MKTQKVTLYIHEPSIGTDKIIATCALDMFVLLNTCVVEVPLLNLSEKQSVEARKKMLLDKAAEVEAEATALVESLLLQSKMLEIVK